MQITKETILKFDRPGPRYTSYPTAPEWSEAVTANDYRHRLDALGRTAKTISLYIHIPFCETLCYFCACTMNVRKKEEKYGDEYLDHLEKEMQLVAGAIGCPMTVRQLHWGGGTPSFLSERQMERLFAMTGKYFHIDLSGEIAIEIDPRRVTESKMRTLKELGFNRVSIGVQDFDPRVQEAVNRIQPFEDVRRFAGWCRELRFDSVNFDLIYGLPFQTLESFSDTVEKTIELRPDRIALYSFAHVPWLKKHQQKLDAAQMPDNERKLDIFLQARRAFLENGYQAVAMDHFALKEDELSRAYNSGTLYRNFMGYTVKPADEYIGMGTSSIGFLENGFFQNYKTIPEYYRFLEQGQIPVERGKILTRDDRIRQWVIWSLMCRFKLDKTEFDHQFDCPFDHYFEEEQEHINRCREDGLLDVENNVIVVTDLGKIFIRNVAMGFDWYLRQSAGHKKFSRTV